MQVSRPEPSVRNWDKQGFKEREGSAGTDATLPLPCPQQVPKAGGRVQWGRQAGGREGEENQAGELQEMAPKVYLKIEYELKKQSHLSFTISLGGGNTWSPWSCCLKSFYGEMAPFALGPVLGCKKTQEGLGSWSTPFTQRPSHCFSTSDPERSQNAGSQKAFCSLLSMGERCLRKPNNTGKGKFKSLITGTFLVLSLKTWIPVEEVRMK